MFCSKAALLLRPSSVPSRATRCCYILKTNDLCSNLRRIPSQCRHDLPRHSFVADPLASGSGYLAGLASTQAVQAAETLFCVVHSSLHLPWWAAIVATTFTLRALTTSPLAVHQAKMAARTELLLPTVRELQEAVKHRVVTQCRREGVALEEANRRMMKEVRRSTHQLYWYHGCHPAKMYLLPWIQLPLWLTLSLALRNMSGAWPGTPPNVAVHVELASGGMAWFHDLTAADPLLILPAVLVVSNLINIEMHAMRVRVQPRRQVLLSKFFRYLTVGMGLVASQLPAAMSLYWASSSMFGLLQNALLKLPRVRRYLSVPKTPSEHAQPFQAILQSWQQRAERFLQKQQKHK